MATVHCIVAGEIARLVLRSHACESHELVILPHSAVWGSLAP